MYYTITSVTPEEVRLDLASKYMNLGEHVFAFVFDNSKGAIRVIQDKSEESVAWIPYEDVDYFEILKKSTGSGRNTFYEVHMHLKSLAVWRLFQTSYENKALAELDKLKAGIQLDKKSVFIDKPKLPSEIINVSHANGNTVLRWRNSAKVSDAVKLGVIGLLVGAALLFIVKLALAQSFFGFLIALVIFIIYLVVMYGKITTLMKDHITEYGFAFGPKDVEYFEESISSKQKKFSSLIAINEWNGLSYPSLVSGPDVITSINGDAYKQYFDLVKSRASIKEVYEAKKKTMTSQDLRIKDLHPVQLLNTANWIREEIKKSVIVK